MEPRPSATNDDAGTATATFSLTVRACLQALAMAAWLEAMIVAHHAAGPQNVGGWLWFLTRCLLFSMGAYMVVSFGASIARRRAAKPPKVDDEPAAPARLAFDALAFEATAGALLFHFGAPLWMWIFR